MVEHRLPGYRVWFDKKKETYAGGTHMADEYSNPLPVRSNRGHSVPQAAQSCHPDAANDTIVS